MTTVAMVLQASVAVVTAVVVVTAVAMVVFASVTVASAMFAVFCGCSGRKPAPEIARRRSLSSPQMSFSFIASEELLKKSFSMVSAALCHYLSFSHS